MNIIDSNIIGESKAIELMRNSIKTMAQYPATVLITGETGTGKELVARGLHYGGELSSRPFIAINCSTFSDELFASELFGYKKGAFTDAKSDKEGLLISVNGGTIFLDEIDSLSLKSQAALLRVLQESEFRPIGSNSVLKTNVRFIAAANCNLETKMANKEFRQDLYFRLYILSINVPALRERKEDIGVLIEHFIDKLNSQYGLNKMGISSRLMAKFTNHDWPGNIRELENTIHRYYLLASGELLDDSPALDMGANHTAPLLSNDLSTESNYDHIDNSDHVAISNDLMKGSADTELDAETKSAYMNFSDAKRKAIEVFEAKFVSRLLHLTNGNVTKAANLCGKERRAFGKLVKKYHVKNNGVNLY
ncbi:sigma 54-interacting transcriptional regulator [Marinomonas transparens]|uniref:Sigma-54-dependent Fis family transcriptional regulator n=1 Tax=Marinomonas transparens TaxID=2795388 RepID=A0A934K008_9GAMM|nr:sigma-54 dependent transcriptional regulator [Marinomonas transparens]MBJ7540012.1 sigma-54-dependent Fis family transcriptional regulator [Marinomonas transparens]